MKTGDSDKNADDLAATLGRLPSGRIREALAASEKKTRRLDIRVSESELGELREMADELGISVSAYLLQLHRLAREALRPDAPEPGSATVEPSRGSGASKRR